MTTPLRNRIQDRVARFINTLKSQFSGKQYAYAETGEGGNSYRRPHTSFLQRTSIRIILVVLVVLVILYMMLYFALPGSALYGAKTKGMEELFAKMRITENAQTDYRLTLLERRFNEVERLAQKNEPVSEDAANAFLTEITREVEVLRSVIETNENLPLEDILDDMQKASAILLATEFVAEENEHLIAIADPVEDLRQDAESTQKDLTALFTMRTPTEELRQYIEGQLELLVSEIGDVDLSEENLARTTRYIERAQTAIANDNATRAITAIHDALQTIAVAKYLDRKPEEEAAEEPEPEVTPEVTNEAV